MFMFIVIIFGLFSIFFALAAIIAAIQNSVNNGEGLGGIILTLLKLIFTMEYGGFGCMVQIGLAVAVIIIMALLNHT